MKNRGKETVMHIGAVIKRMLFIGFTIQIILGIVWMCCNFMQVQDFGGMYFADGNSYLEDNDFSRGVSSSAGENASKGVSSSSGEDTSRKGNLSGEVYSSGESNSSGGYFSLGGIYSPGGYFSPGGFFSPLYHNIFSLLGKFPPIMYLLQTAFAFYCGYHFLCKSLQRRYAIWGSLALVTFPFAMQCHLAILPYSFLGSFMLLLFSNLRRLWNKESILRSLGQAAVCAVLIVAMSGWIGGKKDEEEVGRSFEAVMASRMAWFTLWVDFDRWSEDLQEMTEEVALQATYYPGNMKLLEEAIESRVGTETAREYYWQIAEVGWTYHAPMIIRQIGWDVLGYAVTPVIFRLQLKGQSYDSYTGRNYEAMRGNAPIITRYYIEYGCWWFGCSLILTFVLTMVRLLLGGRIHWKAPLLIVFISAVWIVILTMQGAGIMDYKYTIAVNELWMIWSFLIAFGSIGNLEQEIQIRKSFGGGCGGFA